MGHPDLSPAADAEPGATPLRIAICGSAGAGRRTLLAALGAGQGDTDIVASDRDEIGAFAAELLEPPPVAVTTSSISFRQVSNSLVASDWKTIAALPAGSIW